MDGVSIVLVVLVVVLLVGGPFLQEAARRWGHRRRVEKYGAAAVEEQDRAPLPRWAYAVGSLLAAFGVVWGLLNWEDDGVGRYRPGWYFLLLSAVLVTAMVTEYRRRRPGAQKTRRPGSS